MPQTLRAEDSRTFWQTTAPSPVTVIHGDATDKNTLTRSSVDLTVTSPPYNLGMKYSGKGSDDFMEYEDYLAFSKAWIKNCYLWTRNTGRFCLNVGLDKNKGGKRPVCADLTRIAMEVGWNYHATIVWNEGNISRHTAWGSWMSASAPHVIAPVEVIIVLHKGEWKRERRGKNDITADDFKNWVKGIWTFTGESARRIGHEAPFPRELPKRCIQLFSFIGDTVLDPFCGSGTTLIEAAVNGRRSFGIEKEEKYCRLSSERVKKEAQAALDV